MVMTTRATVLLTLWSTWPRGKSDTLHRLFEKKFDAALSEGPIPIVRFSVRVVEVVSSMAALSASPFKNTRGWQ